MIKKNILKNVIDDMLEDKAHAEIYHKILLGLSALFGLTALGLKNAIKEKEALYLSMEETSLERRSK